MNSSPAFLSFSLDPETEDDGEEKRILEEERLGLFRAVE